jgi:two-component system response regulator
MSVPGADLLLVDDDSNDIAIAMRAFRQHALDGRVVVMQGGAELVDYLLGVPTLPGSLPPVPKVILLDLKMPRIDGKAVLRTLRANARTRHIPIVIVSWSAQEQDKRECYELGANSFVVKRLDAQRPGQYLVDAARYWLETNESTR